MNRKEIVQARNSLQKSEACYLKINLDDNQNAGWSFGKGPAEFEFNLDENCMSGQAVIPVKPVSRLILLGAGHVSRELAVIGRMINFRVVVADNRAEFVTAERFPGCLLICDSFEKALEDLRITNRDFVCVLTRGHADDFTCLHWVLEHAGPAYIGQIGSKRKVIQFMDALKKEGFESDVLKKVHAPIGLDIQASTPAEIAVAIAAQLIEVRAGLSKESFDLDVSIFEQMKGLADECAWMMIVKSSGSLPRKTGASMAVDRNGKTAGTIGGGKGEALSLETAKSLIGTGTWQLLDISMDKNMAQKDGLICGGTMQVLIADLSPKQDVKNGQDFLNDDLPGGYSADCFSRTD